MIDLLTNHRTQLQVLLAELDAMIAKAQAAASNHRCPYCGFSTCNHSDERCMGETVDMTYTPTPI